MLNVEIGIIHFASTIMLLGIGMYVGKIMEVTKQLKKESWKFDQMIMEGFTQKSSCQFCPDNDLMQSHPVCLQCCYHAIRDLRMIVPLKVWIEGARAYDWAGHFQMEYRNHHERHLLCEPTIKCPTCKSVSFNTNDIKHKFCGNCHKFHDQMEPI
jgi:hypothetical protein